MENDFINIRGELMGLPASSHLASKGSRAEFQKHFDAVPQHIKDELEKGAARLADQVIYSIKPITSKTVKLFETQDSKATGQRNISNAKLEKNQSLLVSGIYLMAGVAKPAGTGGPTPDEVMAIDFLPVSRDPLFAALVNGEFNLKANKVQLVPDTPIRLFAANQGGLQPEGYYKLHNPRLIQDDVAIEATVELGTVLGIPDHAYLFIGLHGTITTA
jgi:hypothetical protein